jgi:hypothetical protein
MADSIVAGPRPPSRRGRRPSRQTSNSPEFAEPPEAGICPRNATPPSECKWCFKKLRGSVKYVVQGLAKLFGAARSGGRLVLGTIRDLI